MCRCGGDDHDPVLVELEGEFKDDVRREIADVHREQDESLAAVCLEWSQHTSANKRDYQFIVLDDGECDEVPPGGRVSKVEDLIVCLLTCNKRIESDCSIVPVIEFRHLDDNERRLPSMHRILD
jgi:hypothetical protein